MSPSTSAYGARRRCVSRDPIECGADEEDMAQWPDEELLPGFKDTFLRYLAQTEKLSYEFIGLLAEAFGLPREIMRGFYETDGPTPHRAKVVKYPPLDDLASNQGVGPHFDGGFLTFVRPTPRFHPRGGG